MPRKMPWDRRRFLAFDPTKKLTQMDREKADIKLNWNRVKRVLKEIASERQLIRIQHQIDNGSETGPAIERNLTVNEHLRFVEALKTRENLAKRIYQIRRKSTKAAEKMKKNNPGTPNPLFGIRKELRKRPRV